MPAISDFEQSVNEPKISEEVDENLETKKEVDGGVEIAAIPIYPALPVDLAERAQMGRERVVANAHQRPRQRRSAAAPFLVVLGAQRGFGHVHHLE